MHPFWIKVLFFCFFATTNHTELKFLFFFFFAGSAQTIQVLSGQLGEYTSEYTLN